PGSLDQDLPYRPRTAANDTAGGDETLHHVAENAADHVPKLVQPPRQGVETGVGAVEDVRQTGEQVPQQVSGTALGRDIDGDRAVVAIVKMDVEAQQGQIHRPQRQVQNVVEPAAVAADGRTRSRLQLADQTIEQVCQLTGELGRLIRAQ